MFPRPRYHNTEWWTREDRSGVYMAARALTRLLEAERCRNERQDRSWHPPRPWRPGWSSEPRRFDGPPPRGPFRRGLPQGRWLPSHNRDPRRGSGWQRQPPRQIPPDWRFRVMPRRGPHVAAIRVPGGTCRRSGRRGSLVGFNPEALCGEAPKGQPMIRRENIEALRGDAPQGQPRNHRPRSKNLTPQGQRGKG